MKKYVFVTSALIALVFYTLSNKPNSESAKQLAIENIYTIDEVVESQEDIVTNVALKTAPLEKTHPTDPTPEFTEKVEQYKNLSKTILMSRSQKAQWQSLLSDRKFIDQNYLQLTNVTGLGSLKKQIKASIRAIDILNSALSWKENPIRSEVVENIKYILFEDITANSKNIQLRKALAANQAELYLSLKTNAPPTALEVKRLARGKRLGELIEFAEDNLQ